MVGSPDLAAAWSSLQVQLEAHRPRQGDPLPAVASDSAMTPVCLLTGFLGAGKSTLLAALLVSPPESMVVRAVVNDVGRLPFDPTLVAAAANLQIELTNGCGCCQATGELAAALAGVAADGCDLLVLEASGGADPFALAQVVEASAQLDLERIVAVVDASTVTDHLRSPGIGPLVRRQLESAHVVVMSHTDAMTSAELSEVSSLVADVAPGRQIEWSSVDRPASGALLPGHPRGARLPPVTPGGDGQLVTVTVAQEVEVSRRAVTQVLSSARGSGGLLRAKGWLRLDGEPYLVQATSSSLSVVASEGTPNHPALTLTAQSSADLVTVAELLLGSHQSVPISTTEQGTCHGG